MLNPRRQSADIAFFFPTLTGGGAERVMVTLARGFNERGVRVDLVLVRAQGPYLADVPTSMRILDFGKTRIIASLPSMVRYLRAERPPKLLAALDFTNLIALWSKKLAHVNTEVIISQHQALSESTKNSSALKIRLLPYIMHWTYPYVDKIIAVSDGVAEDLAKAIALPRKRVKVIYNPVVTPELFDKAKAPLEHPWFTPGEPPVILGVGRLTEQKDFPNLLQAFARVRCVHPARLIILGEGEERPRLEALVQQLRLTDDVSLPGFVSNPYNYMARAAVFVLSSRWEGLPTVLIESMAAGIPAVVSTDCPSGPAEILEHGRYGALVSVGDSPALAQAILEAIQKHPTDNLRKRAVYFSADRIVQQYIDFLSL